MKYNPIENEKIVLDAEVELIKEKCVPNPSKDLCLKCMKEKQGISWMRVARSARRGWPPHGRGQGDAALRNCGQIIGFTRVHGALWRA